MAVREAEEAVVVGGKLYSLEREAVVAEELAQGYRGYRLLAAASALEYKGVRKITWETATDAMALIQTASDVYEVYIDCKKGLVSQGNQPVQFSNQASLITDICHGHPKWM
jgi:hypothetical protein